MTPSDLRALCERVLKFAERPTFDHYGSGEKDAALASSAVDISTECLALLDANEKMRGALEWYADKSHYDNLEHLKGPHLPAIDRDYGQIARRALNKLGERT